MNVSVVLPPPAAKGQTAPGVSIPASLPALLERPDPMDRDALIAYLEQEKALHRIKSSDSERLTALLKYQQAPASVAIRIAELHALQFQRDLNHTESRELRRLQLDPNCTRFTQVAHLRNLQQYRPSDPALTPEAIRNLERVLDTI